MSPRRWGQNMQEWIYSFLVLRDGERCDQKMEICRKQPWPSLTTIEGEHQVACYIHSEEKTGEPVTK